MIAVVGCGNANRSDDGVGPRVICTLRTRGLEQLGVCLIDAGTDGMATMFAARGCRSLIIVDACRTESEPGTIFQVPGDEVERAYTPALTMHDFRWDHALFVGRKIFRDAFPTDVIVLLVEASTLDFGIGLSSAVSAAAATVVERVEDLIQARLRGG